MDVGGEREKEGARGWVPASINMGCVPASIYERSCLLLYHKHSQRRGVGAERMRRMRCGGGGGSEACDSDDVVAALKDFEV
jgi:hypothetical protein